jgi:hypothetical protein
MASAHIQINGTGSRHNQKVRRFVDELIAVRTRREPESDVRPGGAGRGLGGAGGAARHRRGGGRGGGLQPAGQRGDGVERGVHHADDIAAGVAYGNLERGMWGERGRRESERHGSVVDGVDVKSSAPTTIWACGSRT